MGEEIWNQELAKVSLGADSENLKMAQRSLVSFWESGPGRGRARSE